jgi:uncharacterized membrane protein YhaH (DUF805 family)
MVLFPHSTKDYAMNFTEAISSCLKKYATFDGTASRAEYWWFWLFCFLAPLVVGVVSDKLGAAVSLALLVPILAAGARRLHETDRSGWWQLVMLIPFIGWIVLIVLMAQEGKPNRYEAAVLRA